MGLNGVQRNSHILISHSVPNIISEAAARSATAWRQSGTRCSPPLPSPPLRGRRGPFYGCHNGRAQFGSSSSSPLAAGGGPPRRSMRSAPSRPATTPPHGWEWLASKMVQSVGTESAGLCTQVLAPDSTSHAQGSRPGPARRRHRGGSLCGSWSPAPPATGRP